MRLTPSLPLDNDVGVLISACLFGDGAGAAVLSNSANGGRCVKWHSSGSLLKPGDRDLLRLEQKDGMLRNILPPQDRQAVRSRRDLRLLNALMGHPSIIASALGNALNGESSQRIVELGAGDGHFLLRVARRLNGRVRNVEATLVDRLDVFDPTTCARFGALGWRVKFETADALVWLRRVQAEPVEVVVANLFLHHFTAAQLAEAFQGIARSTRAFIALEPRRGHWPLVCSRMFWLIGCGPVTRHDGPISVRAGFDGGELSSLWPDAQNWALLERPAGLFSHLFIARHSFRGGADFTKSAHPRAT